MIHIRPLAYMAAALCANAALAQEMGDGQAALAAVAKGDMKKLVVHDAPKPAPTAEITDAGGGTVSLADYEGQHVLLNFWATWCAPCREEMPSLDALQADRGGDDFQVVPVATGRNPLPGIREFFAEEGVENLPILLDPKQDLAREMAVLGLPITVILDPEGREIARLRGEADWASENAAQVLDILVQDSGAGG